jgi:predicted phage terminase large subunit-like protein
MDRGSVKVREYYPTDKGKKDIDVEGKPLLKTQEDLIEKRKSMGLYVYGCQMLQDPTADKAAGFNIDWIRYYTVMKKFEKWNFYLLADPAGEKKKTSDYTVMVVLGLAEDGNYYLMDGFRDKLNLTERTNKLFELHRKWNPVRVGYEKYGLQADIEHIEYVQEQEGYRFHVEQLGGSMPKNDRIRRMVPIFEQRRFYIPYKLLYQTAEGKAADFIDQFLNAEYVNFPVASHDDCLDSISRICDEAMQAVFPKIKKPEELREVAKEYDPLAIPK